ncbi:Cell wall integrity and stress response component 4 [Ciborinia camelliae]|nr:Cell wall integrity and stress response component 4 [Ciborinia camelliae]
MFHSLLHFYPYGVAAIFGFALIEHVNGLTMEYCSSLNTGSGDGNSSIYQSDGLCYNTCVADYAFAIVQGQYCWCSNYVPGTTTSISDCNTSCPGYPSDTCGGDGTYGYISLTLSPSGTKTASATTASSSSSKVIASSSSPDAVTIFSTVTEAISSTDPPKTTASTSASDTTTPSTLQTTVSSTSASTSSTWTPTPVVSLETITGQVRTVTVTPTSPPSESNTSSVSKGSEGGLTTGGAVGLTIGLVALFAIIAGIIFFCIRKRKQEKAEAYAAVNSRRESLANGMGGPIPSRTMSENSRYVLGTDGRRVVETWEPELNTPGSRKSPLMPVDPRLNPFAAVYLRSDNNKSRESINTIRDDHDYSRRVHQQGPILRAVNPDPD